jgi:hypothetical protein
MKKTLALLILILAAGAVAWFVVSPDRAVDRLRTAARESDTATLESMVEFDSVRTYLKADLRATLDAGTDGNGPGAFATAFGGALTDGVVDMLVSPEGIAALVRGDVPFLRARDRPDVDAVELEIERDGLDTFRALYLGEGNEEDRPALVFRRDGLDWRVVRIEIPALARLLGQTGRQP